MKKLFLAVSICAAFFASSTLWAAKSVATISENEIAQRDIAQAALISWAKDVVRDMKLSADPLARAMGDVSLQLWAAQDEVKISISRLTAEQKQALYSAKTPVPLRIFYLQAACYGYNRDPLCGDAELADALIAADSKNAFTILLAESLRGKNQMQAALTERDANSAGVGFDELFKAQAANNMARILPRLHASTEFYDYGQAFKAPILIAVKRRPPPPEVFASLPIEVAALTAAFAPEEIAAEALANALIAVAASTYQPMNACGTPQGAELKLECARVTELILANPKNSAMSAAYAMSQSENHAYSKRISAFDKGAQEKLVDPSTLLTLDWLALRGVLNKAATQGDVAAIPDALTWAELAYAKLPNKSPDDIAAESKVRAEQKAKWEAENEPFVTDAAVAAAAVATDAAVADTAGTVAAGQAATSTTDAELKHETGKSSGGCDADSEVKVDPTAIEFKNDGM